MSRYAGCYINIIFVQIRKKENLETVAPQRFQGKLRWQGEEGFEESLPNFNNFFALFLVHYF